MKIQLIVFIFEAHLYAVTQGDGLFRKNQFSDTNRKKGEAIDFEKIYIDDILAAHNKYRTIHQAPRLTLDPALALRAEHYAEELARRVPRENRTRSLGFGVNTAIFNGDIDVAGDFVVEEWYHQINHYPFDGEPSARELRKVRKFTQVVWKSTEFIGCAQKRNGLRLVFVCYYWPPGNIPGEFEDEVLPQE
ncbi:unnamed protein product [Bemisia tabaci]|uniref:SCP domain-containing protein n=1 Tax=Bemisia tabaci TaxID=7038 RepID=A0A9P0CAN6_BEMTA|nr:unnamed protein product [Bemisia tabaci]